MFGSKLRSWMETHIVRPRKKGSKHKQAVSEAGSSCSGKKAGTLPPQGSNLTSPVLTSSGSHSIASPVRRREVSPIQCHVSAFPRGSLPTAYVFYVSVATQSAIWLAIPRRRLLRHNLTQVGQSALRSALLSAPPAAAAAFAPP